MFKKQKQRRKEQRELKKQQDAYFSQIDLNKLNNDINSINKIPTNKDNNLLLTNNVNAVLFLIDTINKTFNHDINLSNLDEKEKVRIDNEYTLNNINLIDYFKNHSLKEQLKNDIDLLIAQTQKINNSFLKHLYVFESISINRNPNKEEYGKFVSENIEQVTEDNVFINKFSKSQVLNIFTNNKLFISDKDVFIKSLPSIIFTFLDIINDIQDFLLRYKTIILHDNFIIDDFKSLYQVLSDDLNILSNIVNGTFLLNDRHYDLINNTIIINKDTLFISRKIIEKELEQNSHIFNYYV